MEKNKKYYFTNERLWLQPAVAQFSVSCIDIKGVSQ